MSEMLAAIERMLQRSGEGSFGIVYHDGEWSVMGLLGREAPDSPMAGGAVHGAGQNMAEALREALSGHVEDSTDPRELGGEISGPGGPFDWGEAVLDSRRAILVDYTEVAKVDPESASDSDESFAVLFSGRINRSDDRANVMLLGDIGLLATIVTEIHGICERAGKAHHEKLLRLCEARWAEIPHP